MRLFAALCLVATPVWATVDGWPALYDVTGVAADDVLNIRSAPDASAEIVGSLAPDAANIEVIRPNDRETWALVNTGEGTGWVSLAFLARQPGQWDGQIPAITQCFGTEPFWSLERTGGQLRFRHIDSLSVTVDEAYFVGAEGRRGRFAASGSSVTQGLTLFVANETCSDGMSDREFGWRGEALVEDMFDSILFSGCCSLAPR